MQECTKCLLRRIMTDISMTLSWLHGLWQQQIYVQIWTFQCSICPLIILEMPPLRIFNISLSILNRTVLTITQTTPVKKNHNYTRKQDTWRCKTSMHALNALMLSHTAYGPPLICHHCQLSRWMENVSVPHATNFSIFPTNLVSIWLGYRDNRMSSNSRFCHVFLFPNLLFWKMLFIWTCLYSLLPQLC